MPINPPASNTQSGNGSNLYLLKGEINIPDPLIINDLVVTNRATITDLTVSSGTITLSDTIGDQTLQAIGTELFFDGQLLAKAGDIQNISDWALYPANADVNIDGKNIENVLKITDSTNVFGTNGQYLSSDGSKIEWTTPVSGGVTQLNSLTGNVNITSTNNDTLTVTQVDKDIQLTVVGGSGVQTLNTLTGAVNITSTNENLTVAQVGQDIQLTIAGGAGVESLNTLTGAVNITSTNTNLTVAQVDQNIELTVLAGGIGVESLNTLAGAVNITSTNTNLTVAQVAQNVEFTVLAGGIGVESLNGVSGAITISGSDTAQVGVAGQTLTVTATTLGVSTDLTTTCWGAANSAQLSATSAGITAGTALADAATAQATATSAGITAGSALTTATLALSQSGITQVNTGTGQVVIQAGTGINVNTSFSSGTTNPTLTITNTINSIPYSLTGTQAGAVIVNRGIGAGNALIINTFTVISSITFNLPATLNATDGIYYDGFNFCDFDANFNSFWGISYTTNTFLTETVLIGSITATANALDFSNLQQIYLPTNLIIPPTYLTGGGTVTLRIYCRSTSSNHYLSVAPINTARIGVVSN